MKITVCVGSSCHLKGSRQVVEQLQSLVAEAGLQQSIELCGAFCMGNCVNGVCVKIEDELFSLKPETTALFFHNEVLRRIGDTRPDASIGRV